jgi:glutathione-regulated potassium-efflux system ancillary protein KefG
VSPKVDTEDLLDTQEVADLLGLSHRNSVTTYLRRYEDFPRPIVERGGGRTRLWARREVVAWRDRRPR